MLSGTSMTPLLIPIQYVAVSIARRSSFTIMSRKWLPKRRKTNWKRGCTRKYRRRSCPHHNFGQQKSIIKTTTRKTVVAYSAGRKRWLKMLLSFRATFLGILLSFKATFFGVGTFYNCSSFAELWPSAEPRFHGIRKEPGEGLRRSR